MRRLVLAAFLLVVACGAVPAQAHSLTLGFHSGDTYKYSFHSTTKQIIGTIGITVPAAIEQTASETVKVKSVSSAGVADLAVTLSNFSVKSTTGTVTNTTTGIPDTTMDVSVAADGSVLSVDEHHFAGPDPFMAFTGLGGSYFVSAVLPTNAVKPGDTWSKDYDQADPSGTGTIHVTSKSKYVRDESINGVNAAVVETTSTSSIDLNVAAPVPGSAAASALGGMSIKATVTADVTTWVDPNGHRVLKTHSAESNDGTITNNLSSTKPLPGLTGTVTYKGTGTTDLTPA